MRSSRWKFPDTPAEKKSMAVFEDLWGKGLCPVSGSNYGADYVVYNGKNNVFLQGLGLWRILHLELHRYCCRVRRWCSKV